jgi:hypothetical protein
MICLDETIGNKVEAEIEYLADMDIDPRKRLRKVALVDNASIQWPPMIWN